MFRELKLIIALKLIDFGLWIYDVNHGMQLDSKDLEYIAKLNKLKNELEIESKSHC